MLLALIAALALPAAAAPDLEKALRADALAHAKALIRLDTSHPPGNELVAAEYIKEALAKDGIASELYTSTGTRTSVVARLKGDGSKRPLLLMCHTDVVPADAAAWTVPPFAATVKDGYLYGRGAADIKSMCGAQMAVLSWLARSKTPLARDVVFFGEADEETGAADRHIMHLLKDRPELVDAELAINEGGHAVWKDGAPVEIRVNAAEKEYMDVVLTAKGRPGHSSRPYPDNAIARLARALARLSAHRFPVRLNPVSEGFLRAQAARAEPARAKAIRAVLDAPEGPARDAAGDALAALDAELGAMLRDTVTPTILKAGYKANVIPGEAEATVNTRLLPGRKAEELVAELEAVIADPEVSLAYVPPTRDAVGAMPVDTPLYAAVVAAAKRRAPRAVVTPFMAAWTTDSQDLRARGTVVYGVDPPLTDEDDRRVHGDDERLPLAALDWYALFLRDVVVATAGAEALAAGGAR